MDWITIRSQAKVQFGKYKYVLLILGLGILLMSLPEGKGQEQEPRSTVVEAVTPSQADELEEILSQIAGVGKVRVMLTEAAGAETIYQTNEDRSYTSGSESIRVDTVLVTNSDRTERGLVRSVTPPIFLGAIVVCQGGDSPAIKFAVVEAVSNVTGIGSDRITVLKMK